MHSLINDNNSLLLLPECNISTSNFSGGIEWYGVDGSSGGECATNDNSSSNTTSPFAAAELLSESWWNVLDERFLRHNLGWTITLIVAYVIILIIGVIGNSMVILVVVRRPQMRSVTNIFIMNLAVADLFVILFCLPPTLLSNIFTPWMLGSKMCKGVTYVQGVSVCASAYSLAAVSLDRCKAIYYHMERSGCLSKTQALATACLIWIIGLLLAIPWAVVFDVTVSERDGLSYCVESWENEMHGKIYFLVVNLICFYALPLVLISISNVIILCQVSHRQVPQDSASDGHIKRMHKKTRYGVLKMLGIVTLTFLLCWLPLYMIMMRLKFGSEIGEEGSNLLNILIPFAQWLGSMNSSINPVLYAFLNSRFREMFKSLLPAWFPFLTRNNAGLMRTGTFMSTRSPTHISVYTSRASTVYRTSSSSSNNTNTSSRISVCHLPQQQQQQDNHTSYRRHQRILLESSSVQNNGERGGSSTALFPVAALNRVATTSALVERRVRRVDERSNNNNCNVNSNSTNTTSFNDE